MQQPIYMYGNVWDDWSSDVEDIDNYAPEPVVVAGKQHRMDSLMESVCNIAVGFFISWAVWLWVVAPLFGFSQDGKTSFLITCIFTVTSLIRQYVLRRIFDGKTIWETIRGRFAS